MAEVVHSAADKMRCLEVAVKKGVCGAHLTALIALHSEVNRSTGITEISQKDLAEFCGFKSVRTAERATTWLDQNHHLKILHHIRNGRIVCGGWGAKNRYDMRPRRQNDDTQNRPSEEKGDLAPRKSSSRPSHKSNSTVTSQQRTYCSLESHKHPSEQTELECNKTAKNIWQQELLKRLGQDKMECWFEDVTVDFKSKGMCVLFAPTLFKAKYISNHFYKQVLLAMQVQDGSIIEVLIEVAKGEK